MDFNIVKKYLNKSYVVFSHELVMKIGNLFSYVLYTLANCEISFFTYYVT